MNEICQICHEEHDNNQVSVDPLADTINVILASTNLSNNTMTKAQPPQPAPKTQKGKSIFAGCPLLTIYCNRQYLRGYAYDHVKTTLYLIQSQQDIDNLKPSVFSKEIFARPCPKTPRHGFVDSRVIANKKELSLLLEEVLRADPDGEIVLTEFISKAKYNAVLSTSGLLSIGPGHDGATAGKKSFSIPVKPENLFATYKNVVKESGLTENDNIFLEAVFTKPAKIYGNNNPSLDTGIKITQVRGGPAVQSVNDYVPKKLKITKIVSPNDDLLAWESEVKKFIPGTAVYGPGHTLASHAAIHCVINEVPFITSFKPVIGQEIEPVLARAPALNHRQFRLGTTVGLTNSPDMKLMFHTSVAIIHNWAYIRNSPHASWMLGLSAAYLSKIMCALNYGEYRHFSNKHYIKRTSVYKKVMASKRIGIYMRKSPQVAATFTNKKKQKYAYGGPRWARAVKANIRIWNSIADIHKFGLTNTRAKKLLMTLNRSVNLLHNNGWLFNKISDQTCLDTLQQLSGLAIFQMSDVLYDSYKKINKIKRLRDISFVDIQKAA